MLRPNKQQTNKLELLFGQFNEQIFGRANIRCGHLAILCSILNRTATDQTNVSGNLLECLFLVTRHYSGRCNSRLRFPDRLVRRTVSPLWQRGCDISRPNPLFHLRSPKDRSVACRILSMAHRHSANRGKDLQSYCQRACLDELVTISIKPQNGYHNSTLCCRLAGH
jgi:hypothetical protein